MVQGDFHIHTTRSMDVKPESMGRSARSHVRILSSSDHYPRVVSFTEHDKFSLKYPGDYEFARERGILLVPGVEFDASHANYGNIHILAYFPVRGRGRQRIEQFRPISGLTRAVTNRRMIACNRICELLIQKGVFNPEPVHRRQSFHPNERIATKREIYQMLMDPRFTNREYVCSSMDKAEEALKVVHRADVEIKKENAGSLVALVQSLGGVSSLAHPFRLLRGGRKVSVDDVVDFVEEVPVDGVEVFYPYYCFPGFSIEESKRFVSEAQDITRRRKLMVTGGSDYHGDNARNKGAALGNVVLPEQYTLRLVDRLDFKLPKK